MLILREEAILAVYLCASVKENIFGLNTPAQPVLPQWEFHLPSTPQKEHFSVFTHLSKHCV